MITVSVITICFNNLDELKQTISSVDKQLTHPFEHIIIDGSSKTAIQTFLETTPQPSYRKWVCERDNGIADAFNKGIAKAKGDFVVMLNAGDIFYDEFAIQKATEKLQSDNTIQWLHGEYEIKRANKWVIIGKPFEAAKVYRGMRSLCHQSMFVRRSLHAQYGEYSSDYKIAMDYDFVLRIAKEKSAFIEYPLVKFEPNGISGTQYYASLAEAKKAYQKHYGFSIYLIFWQLRLKLLYVLLHSPIGNLLYAIKAGLKMENV